MEENTRSNSKILMEIKKMIDGMAEKQKRQDIPTTNPLNWSEPIYEDDVMSELRSLQEESRRLRLNNTCYEEQQDNRWYDRSFLPQGENLRWQNKQHSYHQHPYRESCSDNNWNNYDIYQNHYFNNLPEYHQEDYFDGSCTIYEDNCNSLNCNKGNFDEAYRSNDELSYQPNHYQNLYKEEIQYNINGPTSCYDHFESDQQEGIDDMSQYEKSIQLLADGSTIYQNNHIKNNPNYFFNHSKYEWNEEIFNQENNFDDKFIQTEGK